MASSYGPLSLWYDTLTGDIPYGEFADFYEERFNFDGGEFKTLLDLCCGTGTLTALMAHRGYEMIAVDASADMLMQASGKASDAEIVPLYLCQDACELDLYGTVDAAYCSLDGINYISPDKLGRVFDRLHLFVRPYGLFIFDIKTPESFRALDGEIFVDETDDVLCLWRADFLRRITRFCTEWICSPGAASCGSANARSTSNTPTRPRRSKPCSKIGL